MSFLVGGGKTPQVKPPTPMPDDQSPAVLEAKRRNAMASATRGGRQSTLLQDYSQRTLGGGP